MEEDVFRDFLKKSGRKSNVAEKYIKFVHGLENYLKSNKLNMEKESITKAHLINYITKLENHSKKPARTELYALMQYFKATNNDPMFKVARELREGRKTKKSPFLLKKILDIDPEYIKKLDKVGIKNTEHMLNIGSTVNQRKALSQKVKVPYNVILELVKISDLIRLGYVKEKLTRLYYNAGVQTPQELSKWDPIELHNHFKNYIGKAGWDGMVPYVSDLKNNIARAKKLESKVEYEEN